MPGYQDPYHIYGCANFNNGQCNMLYSAIKFYMASPSGDQCYQMGAEIASSLYNGTLLNGFAPAQNKDGYIGHFVPGVGGDYAGLTNDAFYHGQNWLSYIAGHEMNHLYQGLSDDEHDTNTISNPAAAPAIVCVWGQSAQQAVPGAYTGPQ
jgi:hypothetical protein